MRIGIKIQTTYTDPESDWQNVNTEHDLDVPDLRTALHLLWINGFVPAAEGVYIDAQRMRLIVTDSGGYQHPETGCYEQRSAAVSGPARALRYLHARIGGQR